MRIPEEGSMNYDFSLVDETESFISVPPGTYLCRIAEVREGTARDGSDRWSFRLEVAQGEYAGRTAAWDALTWSERGVLRVKKALEAFGFDVQGTLEIAPDDLKGVYVDADCIIEDWEDPRTGRRVPRLRVPFLGYRAADAPAGASEVTAGKEDPVASSEPF
jgi:hypothetical protein